MCLLGASLATHSNQQQHPESSVVNFNESSNPQHHSLLQLLPSADEMANTVTDGSPKQKKIFKMLYHSALELFDIEGYHFLMSQVMNEKTGERFIQTMAKIDNSLPHCDKGQKGNPGSKEVGAKYPGGAVRGAFGFDLSKWLMGLLSKAQSEAGSQAPGLQNMAMMGMMMVMGFVQSVAGTITDIVPPLIPPPVWINQPLPCLPMITGSNCLGSVLYPISAPDFISANVADSVMSGVISSFPSKYVSKVGKTSQSQYRICATAYLGMYCASIFPICWMPLGLREAQTFPICFPQCLATLIACPGFWLDDIMGPCSDVSVPPFCSFSLFINHKKIPPQISTYEDANPFPDTCPRFDPLYDNSDDLFDALPPPKSPIAEAAKEEGLVIPTVKRMGKTLADYANVQRPVRVEPPVCDCHDMKSLLMTQCHLHIPRDVHIKGNATRSESHYQTPTTLPERCCIVCKDVLEGAVVTKNVKMQEPRIIHSGKSVKAGHVIPITPKSKGTFLRAKK